MGTEVITFDGQFTGFLCWDDLKKIVGQISVLGPIAGMYGRNIEQELMHPKRGYYISERKFAHWVDAARYALKKEVIHRHPDKAKTDRSEQSDDDRSENNTVRKMREILQRQRTNKWTTIGWTNDYKNKLIYSGSTTIQWTKFLYSESDFLELFLVGGTDIF